jgi:hypothetical protein
VQQGVGKRVGDGLDVLDVQAEKVGIVALFDKDILATFRNLAGLRFPR